MKIQLTKERAKGVLWK